MLNPVTELLAAETEQQAHAASDKFGMKLAASDVRPLLAGLVHPNRTVRYHAVYLLGSRWKDKRVVTPLLNVLRNRDEDVDVRGTVADQLAHHKQRRMILPSLIEGSRDPDPAVRFWCVFALGSQVQYQRKPSRRAIQALEARLDDTAAVPGWWQVRLEAIAMLDGVKKSCKSTLFRQVIHQVFASPLDHRAEWKWAEHYVGDSLLALECASRKLAEVGVDPVTFGDGVEGSCIFWPGANGTVKP